eukprot:7416228-Pyramimonas_sp.AAC.1
MCGCNPLHDEKRNYLGETSARSKALNNRPSRRKGLRVCARLAQAPGRHAHEQLEPQHLSWETQPQSCVPQPQPPDR